MAEAFIQVVVENLSSLMKKEIGMVMGVDEEMKKLSSTLTAIQAVLEDAEEKQLENKPIRDWLRKLTDLAYEIDDVLDECATHVSKMLHKNSKLSRYSLKKLLFRHNIGRRMKQVTEKLDGVAAEREKFHLREFAAVERPRQVAATHETCSVLSEHVYDREDDKEEIVDMLVNQVQEKQGLSVLPIIGVGGLGKTTLAQLVFNDPRVEAHFEKKLWVCVSDNFDVKDLIKAMFESATGSGSASGFQHLDALQRCLRELLKKKRYLLVLDDVWNEHQHKWFELRNILACGSAGASIIITTRMRMVADIVRTLPTYYLAGLSDEHCWILLRQRAFGEETTEASPNLEAIGKQVAKKCTGVPLAAKALGGVLRFKRTEDEWIRVRESKIWNLPQDEALILPALRLSYHHLPLALRQCFAYWAAFPKGSRISRKELIFLWMAHGYINSSKDMLEVEDVGNEICTELVLRSFLQVHELGYLYMHDLIHDLAESIMESKIPGRQVEENVTSCASYGRIREVNLVRKRVAFPKSIELDIDMTCILRKFTRLRVLDASDTSIEDLSSEVSHLEHLRCLNLRLTKIRRLPDSLCSLWNLKILNLNKCWNLVALPKNMRRLKNLRHLLLESCFSLSEMPPKIGEMRDLKTLSLFIVGVSKGNKLEELEMLDLGGELEIKHLERVESPIDAKKSNLAQKKNLRALRLKWDRKSSPRVREQVDEEVLTALEPHPNVDDLRIEGFGGTCFPVWMSNNSALRNTVGIEIVDCPNCVRLPKLGELPNLKALRLQKMGVEYIIDDEVEGNTQFPSLECLRLCTLSNLRMLLKEGKSGSAFPKLERLEIESCCSSLILPPFSSLKKLKAVNCGSETLASFSELESLTWLDVSFDDEQTKCFAVAMLEKLTSLEKLYISGAQELPVLEQVRGLASLEWMEIRGGEKPTHIPQGWFPHFTVLRSLTITECQELVELPEDMKSLHSLKTMNLVHLPNMVSLPKALRLLSFLDQLALGNLPQLNSLPSWLHHLTSLRFFYILYCPKLAGLPICIKGMTSLEYLIVRGCPALERRCERSQGEDRHMIAHIPYVRIGDEVIICREYVGFDF